MKPTENDVRRGNEIKRQVREIIDSNAGDAWVDDIIELYGGLELDRVVMLPVDVAELVPRLIELRNLRILSEDK